MRFNLCRNQGMLRSLSILMVLALLLTFFVVAPVSSYTPNCRDKCVTKVYKGDSYTEEKLGRSIVRVKIDGQWVKARIIYERTCTAMERVKECQPMKYCTVNRKCEKDGDVRDPIVLREWTSCSCWKRVGYELEE